MALWTRAKQDLLREVGQMNKAEDKKNDESSREKMLEIGDLTSIYSKVLSLNLEREIVDHLKTSLSLLKMKPDLDASLYTEEDLNHVKSVILEIFHLTGETICDEDLGEDVYKTASVLLDRGHVEKIQEIVDQLPDVELNNTSIDDRLKAGQVYLLKARYFKNC